MLFLVILNFLGDNYKICVITEFDSDDCFASSQCVFLLPFLKACNFDFWKPNMLYQIKEIPINSILV